MQCSDLEAHGSGLLGRGLALHERVVDVHLPHCRRHLVKLLGANGCAAQYGLCRVGRLAGSAGSRPGRCWCLQQWVDLVSLCTACVCCCAEPALRCPAEGSLARPELLLLISWCWQLLTLRMLCEEAQDSSLLQVVADLWLSQQACSEAYAARSGTAGQHACAECMPGKSRTQHAQHAQHARSRFKM